MAKVIFWQSPIDPTKKLEFDTDKRLLIEVLEQIDADKEPLSVILNGEIPDEIPLDLKLNENDVLEIRRIVHGSSSGSKNAWATVITIVALVAATILTAGGASPWLVAGVTLAGGVASGALRYRAAKLAMRGAAQSQNELDIDTNNLSISSAQNEFRALQPIPVPMGSVRAAPDFFNQPYPVFFGGKLSNVQTRVVLDPRLISPQDPDEWTTIIPAGYIASSPYNWPAYPVKLEPSYTLSDLASMTTAQRQDFAPQFFVGPLGSPSRPIICYHHDPADPFFGKLSPFSIFQLQGTQSASQALALQHFLVWHDFPLYISIYGSAPPWWATTTIGISPNPNVTNYFRWKISNTLIKPIASLSNTTQIGQAITQYILGDLNRGISGGPIGVVGFIMNEIRIIDSIYEFSPNNSIVHLFNHGVGDLTITDKRIEKTPIGQIPQLEISPVNKTTWKIPNSFKTDPIAVISYKLDANILEGATLNNNEDFRGPSSFVLINDHNNYNFIRRVTPIGTHWVEIDFVGQLYYAADAGLQENRVTFEIQYKLASSVDWEVVVPVYFFNSNTHIIKRTVVIQSNFGTWPSTEIDFRIRKVETDEANNTDKRIAQFDIAAFKCFGDSSVIDLMATNTEGLFLVANTQTSGSSNKYSAQIDAKCWVYDETTDTWDWDFTRNPAWWFLYFARGGFKNPDADGTFLYPYSPTFGWVNSPTHPSNTEILFGCGMDDSKIDIEGIKDWAKFCDDKNLSIDIVLKDTTTEVEILEKIANIGRGSVSYYKGLLSVVYEDNTQVPVGLYGMGNIIQGSFSADYSVANIPSKVIGTYINRDEGWESMEVEADVPFGDVNNLNYITTTLEGITTEAQAQREVNILAARQFFQKRTYSWKVDKEGLIAKRGDLVYLSHDSTQFSWSGRVVSFLYNKTTNLIEGIDTTSEFKDNDITNVLIRLPNGEILNRECHIEGCTIIFDEEFELQYASYYLTPDNQNRNSSSLYNESMPDDYLFIAGPMETPGKVVRISQIQPDEEMNFTITAIDEDPAMWSYEYGPVINPQSYDESLIVSKVFNVAYKQLGDGKIKLMWETDGADYVKIRNIDTGLLVSAGGLMSFSRGEVILELIEGHKYNLSVEPFVIGSPYKQINVSIIVWA